jgi:hypothetical protein
MLDTLSDWYPLLYARIMDWGMMRILASLGVAHVVTVECDTATTLVCLAFYLNQCFDFATF